MIFTLLEVFKASKKRPNVQTTTQLGLNVEYFFSHLLMI